AVAIVVAVARIADPVAVGVELAGVRDAGAVVVIRADAVDVGILHRGALSGDRTVDRDSDLVPRVPHQAGVTPRVGPDAAEQRLHVGHRERRGDVHRGLGRQPAHQEPRRAVHLGARGRVAVALGVQQLRGPAPREVGNPAVRMHTGIVIAGIRTRWWIVL